MARSNVIIVGSVVLAPLILGIESYALYRAHHRRARTADITGPIEMTAAPVLDEPSRTPRSRVRPSAPSPPPSAAAGGRGRGSTARNRDRQRRSA